MALGIGIRAVILERPNFPASTVYIILIVKYCYCNYR